ncbi:hypothetical protein [Mycolicibacterium vanbaalenii]|uniref:hypothetical protein n=1 Tax=Mycolicibacterium vanbaalenii TaxID=110539 RepID=UPI0013304797|nr:hypothetical protein [Mycolicibacterium vanbaalenii]
MIPRGSDAPIREAPCLDAIDAAKVRATESASHRPLVADPYARALLGRYHRETGHTSRLPATAGGFIEGRLG